MLKKKILYFIKLLIWSNIFVTQISLKKFRELYLSPRTASPVAASSPVIILLSPVLHTTPQAVVLGAMPAMKKVVFKVIESLYFSYFLGFSMNLFFVFLSTLTSKCLLTWIGDSFVVSFYLINMYKLVKLSMPIHKNFLPTCYFSFNFFEIYLDLNEGSRATDNVASLWEIDLFIFLTIVTN